MIAAATAIRPAITAYSKVSMPLSSLRNCLIIFILVCSYVVIRFAPTYRTSRGLSDCTRRETSTKQTDRDRSSSDQRHQFESDWLEAIGMPMSKAYARPTHWAWRLEKKWQ